jgi:hypothetical protein
MKIKKPFKKLSGFFDVGIYLLEEKLLNFMPGMINVPQWYADERIATQR